MEVLGALVSSLLAEPCRALFFSVQSKIKKSLHFQSYFDDLDLQMKDLVKRRNTVKQELESSQKTGLVPRTYVQGWLQEVSRFEAEITAMKEEIKEHGGGNCIDFRFLRSRFREKIRSVVLKMAENAKGLIEAGSFPDGVSAPVRAEYIPGPCIENQSTGARNIAQVMDFLSSDDAKRIAIWGMGGAGKTTLVTNVNNKMKSASWLKDPPFSLVIWVTVSNKMEETSDLKRVQRQIADRLKMVVSDDQGLVRTAVQLHERLEKERFLLILDDVWNPISLDKVGVPRPEVSRGSKILLTTRFSEVCRSMMTDKVLKIEVLNEEEAWVLFRENAGEVVDLEQIMPIAKELTRECCGLPLAICLVGASMRGKAMVELWKDAVSTLRRSEPVSKGIESKVYNPLKLSYDSLPDERIKSCFLLCCLYPEDHLIDVDELIWYWLAEGLLELDDHLSLEHVRIRGISMIECLKDHCLLENGRKKTTVKMHDIVRDVAVWIASSKSVVKSGLGLKRMPREKEQTLKSVERLSFMFNRIHVLPESFTYCPLARTLLLQGNDSLELIHDDFLEAFLSVRLLDLSGCSFKSLPQSLTQLVDLRALILAKCRYLQDIPEVSNLVRLQLLNLSGTNLASLPEGMERLTELRELNLSEIKNSISIRTGSIASLHNLEILSITRFTGKWLSESLLEEVLSLERLSSCSISLSGVHSTILPGDPTFDQIKKLQRFAFYVGNGHLRSSAGFGHESSRKVIFRGFSFSGEWTGWLLCNATSVELVCCEGLNQMFEKIAAMPSVGSFDSLCNLDIAHSNSTFDLTTNGDLKFDLLPNLEILSLHDLARVIDFSRFVEILGLRLQKLRLIKVARCPNLKHLFCLGGVIPKKLENLELINVDSCQNFEELFKPESPRQNQALTLDAAFPRLQKAAFRNLPKLCFSNGDMIQWVRTDKIEVINCHRLRRVTAHMMSFNSSNEI